MSPLTSMFVNEYIYAHSFSKMTSSQVLKECLDEISCSFYCILFIYMMINKLLNLEILKLT